MKTPDINVLRKAWIVSGGKIILCPYDSTLDSNMNTGTFETDTSDTGI